MEYFRFFRPKILALRSSVIRIFRNVEIVRYKGGSSQRGGSDLDILRLKAAIKITDIRIFRFSNFDKFLKNAILNFRQTSQDDRSS